MLANQTVHENLAVITLGELEEILRIVRKKHHRCPECGNENICKFGYTGFKRKPRYRCKKCETTFIDE